MLSNLLIKNYALIRHLEMSPHPGLNIITGETGAGKSIMLGAIGLLLGNRADIKTLYEANEKCVIEGSFDVSGYGLQAAFEEENLDFSTECIIRREIAPSGKSRAFINDTPVNLDTLKKVSSQLLDIHSQHDSVLLGDNDFQLGVVDFYSLTASMLEGYKVSYRRFKAAQKEFDDLRARAVQLKKEFDYDQFLFAELNEAKLNVDEQTALEEELSILENAVEIKERLQTAFLYLDNPEGSAIDLLKNTVSALGQAARLAPGYDALRQRAQSSLIELRDLADEIDQINSSVDIDNERSLLVQERLDLIYNLLKKHQVTTIAELLQIEHELNTKLSIVLNLDEELASLQKKAAEAKATMLENAAVLSKTRKGFVSEIESQILKNLAELGIPNASFTIRVAEIAPGPTGMDAVTFLFSANKGMAPQELRNVASGGEFSRLMMVIKYILADKRKLPTIIFDEIDTGISGEIAKKMASMMMKMADKHQIIAITHLHQIASSGDAHYFVYKDNSSSKTVSNIRLLNTDERIHEIAQMIGGLNPSEAVMTNAREMILKN